MEEKENDDINYGQDDNKNVKSVKIPLYLYIIAATVLVLCIVAFNIYSCFEDVIFFTIKILLSISIGIISTVLTGFVKFVIKRSDGIIIEAGQGFAVALLVFFFFPEQSCNSDYKIIRMNDEINFSQWSPYSNSSIGPCTSIVDRKIVMQIEKNTKNNAPFQIVFSTTNTHCHLNGEELWDKGDIVQDNPSKMPPRETYTFTADAKYFRYSNDSIGYKITYFNNFNLLNPSNNTNEVSKDFSYFTKEYHIKIIFNTNRNWKKIKIVNRLSVNETHSNDTGSNVFEYTIKNIPAGTFYSFYITI